MAVVDDALGRDVALPEDPEDPLRITATGDLAVVSGRENVRAALRRRVVVAAGELLHRPEYGAGVPLYVERSSAPVWRSRLANAVRRNLLRDPRVAEARARVTAGLPDAPDRADVVTVDLAVRLRQDDATEAFTVTVTG